MISISPLSGQAPALPQVAGDARQADQRWVDLGLLQDDQAAGLPAELRIAQQLGQPLDCRPLEQRGGGQAATEPGGFSGEVGRQVDEEQSCCG